LTCLELTLFGALQVVVVIVSEALGLRLEDTQGAPAPAGQLALPL